MVLDGLTKELVNSDKISPFFLPCAWQKSVILDAIFPEWHNCLYLLSMTMRFFLSPSKTRFDFAYPTWPSARPPSAEEAIRLLALHHYDVALSDIRMPLMDGYRLLAHIQHVRPTMPVLLMSGHLDGRHDADGTQAGAFAILHKPLDRETLIRQLQLAFQRAHRDRGGQYTNP